MYRSLVPALVAIVIGLPSWVNGQESGWAPNQVNATMCAWRALRAAQLKDTAYLDGGFLFWTPGLADGGLGVPTQDGNPLGLTYTLNFSIPFDSSTNVSSILKTISLTPNGGANNLKPNYYDGAMLANDHEFFLYGGLLRNTQAYTLPDADEVLYYRATDYGVPKPAFIPGFGNDKLPSNLTRYVTYGGAANAPSENKAWYFGGSRSPSWGPIYQPSNNDSVNPTNVSNTLITLDLSESQSEKWTNVTLPSGIPSRANPSVVWVPVGEQGILVVLGGVAYPQYSTSDQKSLNIAESEKVSPGYVTNIDIYDVASRMWYQQPAAEAEAPPQSAMGCAVVATAQDFSSYNIYYYGGFDGLNSNENYRDDVWVLSLPSFTWTQLSSGSLTHARAGHQCLTPYPDQMVTIGGFRSPKGGGFSCLEGGILQVFNLTQGVWLDSYDPSKWNKYGVPEMIQKKIGGDYDGGATLTAPSPSWAATELASIFATKYETSKLTTYYPYSSQSPDNGTRGDWDGGKKGGGGTPSWVAPVLGVVLGLVFLTAIAVGILLYRRRSLLRKKSGGTDSSGSDERHHFIRTWLNSHNAEKAPTITTDDPSSRYDDMRSRNNTPMPPGGYAASSPTPEMTQLGIQHEMPGNPRFELGDTSRAVELGGEALPYTDVITRYSQLHSPTSPHSGSPHSALKSPSFFTGSVSQDQPSSLSSSQAGINPATAAASMARERPDSPPLGRATPTRTPPPNRDAVVSDLSRISEHHMSHLRNLSGATVSSNSAPSPPTTPPAMQTSFTAGPVSPPLPSPFDEREAGDYVSMHQSMGTTGPSRGPRPSSSLRLSVFRENSEDLGDRPAQSHTQ